MGERANGRTGRRGRESVRGGSVREGGEHVLVVAAEPAREQIARIAAVVGCEFDAVTDLVAARAHWEAAPLVLVDQHAADDPVPDLSRRSRVLLVCTDGPIAGVWQRAVELGADGVLTLPDDESKLVTLLRAAVERPCARAGRVLAIVGARGGAGASVLAAGTGVRAARSGTDALLVDCDPLGGGLDLLLGIETDPGLRWSGVRVSAGQVSMSELARVLPARRHGTGSLSVLSCDRAGAGPAANAVAAVTEAGSHAGRVVVCDLPRRADACTGEVLRRADLVVLVVPAEVRAPPAAARLLEALGTSPARTRVLVRGPLRGGLTVDDIVEVVGAEAVEVASLGWMRPEWGLKRSIERGLFRPRVGGALDRAASGVLAALTASADPE